MANDPFRGVVLFSILCSTICLPITSPKEWVSRCLYSCPKIILKSPPLPQLLAYHTLDFICSWTISLPSILLHWSAYSFARTTLFSFKTPHSKFWYLSSLISHFSVLLVIFECLFFHKSVGINLSSYRKQEKSLFLFWGNHINFINEHKENCHLNNVELF